MNDDESMFQERVDYSAAKLDGVHKCASTAKVVCANPTNADANYLDGADEVNLAEAYNGMSDDMNVPHMVLVCDGSNSKWLIESMDIHVNSVTCFNLDVEY